MACSEDIAEGLPALKNDQWVILRVPYPLGFYTKWVDGRIDNPDSGWKGRGLWACISTRAPFHTEGGQGTPSKVMNFSFGPIRWRGKLPVSPSNALLNCLLKNRDACFAARQALRPACNGTLSGRCQNLGLDEAFRALAVKIRGTFSWWQLHRARYDLVIW